MYKKFKYLIIYSDIYNIIKNILYEMGVQNMTKISLDSLISKVEDMPILPDRINKIISLAEDPYSTVEELEKEILTDQGLTSKILKLANSTYYGYARRIDTVSEATVLLGAQAIKSLALASAVSEYLVKELPGGYGLEKYELWNQSQSCAIISRFIAKKLKYPKAEQAYIAGLLRDIGKTILNYYVAKEYQTIINKVDTEGKTFIEAEEEILGFNHGEVGAKIAEKWNFPLSLVESICYHHSPELSKEDPRLVSIVHIADSITMMLGVGIGNDGLSYKFSDFVLETLNIEGEVIESIICESVDYLNDNDSFSIV